MPHPLPHRYEVSLVRRNGGDASLEAPPRPGIVGGSPPEFDGNDRHWSPEHLLLESVSLCQMLTFAALAKKARLEFSGYSSRCAGTVDKTPSGLAFTAIELRVELTIPSAADAERAAQLLQTAKKYCLVSNSMKAPVSLDHRVLATPPHAP